MTTVTLLAFAAKHWRASVFATLMTLTGALGLLVRHEHAEVSLARAQASAAQAQVAVIKADAARNQAALEAQAADVAARAAADDIIRSSIHASPTSSDCARSPAVAALLRGLHDQSGARTSAGAREPADVRR